ncbi:unnamed protein product [Triticum turgidum subsp. durum]|uniref:Oxidoreductase N-terminal domain-containing protein n=1 Tax=Triticum turgidum subsp. durum TaxID=4567 RepID=A0A9R1QA47_TRITD|nr:unnamed protein product [Triticum turgidum subsp. durum]
MAELKSRRVILKDYVEGYPTEDHMELLPAADVDEAAAAEEGSVLVKNLCLSCDPYMRPKMARPQEQWYTEAYVPGTTITGFGVAQVVRSSLPGLAAGDLVSGVTGWEDYSVIKPPFAGQLTKIRPEDGLPLSYYTGVLGMPGFTAYLAGALKKRFPDGIDVYFENVGGKMLEAVLANMKVHGRIAVCGLISQYNLAAGEKGAEELRARNLVYLISKRIRMQGFVEPDHKHLYPEYRAWVVPHIKDGKVVYVEDVVEGLDAAPGALIGLFHGRNVGKQVVRLANPQ